MQDDGTLLTLFIFDSTLPALQPGSKDRRSLLQLAKNALKKLRTLRHPDVYVYPAPKVKILWEPRLIVQNQIYRLCGNGYTCLHSDREGQTPGWGTARYQLERQSQRRLGRLGSQEHSGESRCWLGSGVKETSADSMCSDSSGFPQLTVTTSRIYFTLGRLHNAVYGMAAGWFRSLDYHE